MKIRGTHGYSSGVGRCLIAAVLLAWGVVAPAGGDPDALPPGQAELKAGLRALEEGDSEEAFFVLCDALRAHPGDEDVNFALGMAAISYDKLSHAAVAFERVVELNPDNDRARLELGRTYAAMGLAGRARDVLQEVLSHSPPETVQRNVERYLDQLGEAEQKWRVLADIGVGGFRDDNVNLGPKSGSISVDPLVFGGTTFTELEVADEHRPQESWGTYAVGSVEARYLPRGPGGPAWVGAGRYYRTWLEDGLRDDELEYLGAWGGVQLPGRRTMTEVFAKIDDLKRGGERLATVYALHPRLVLDGGGIEWRTEVAGEVRDYAVQNDADSIYVDVWQAGTKAVSERWNLGLRIGLFNEDAEAAAFDNYGGGLEVRSRSVLPGRWFLTLTGSYRYARYSEPEVLAPEDRRDHRWFFDAGLSRPLWGPVHITLTYHYAFNDSTFELYEYDRNLLTGGLDIVF